MSSHSATAAATAYSPYSQITQRRPGKDTTPPGRHARRALAVHALVAQLAWVQEARPHWAGEQVVWRLRDGHELRPEAADLARAQYLLHKLRRYPHAGRAVLGDPEEWEAQTLQRLALVDRLRRLRARPDDTILLRDAGRLTALLAAEALCRTGAVPGPPSRALTALAARGGALETTFAPLAASLTDPDLPEEARCLAALTLGATDRARRERGLTSQWTKEQHLHAGIPVFSPAVREALDWGKRRGLPESDAALLALLLARSGPGLASRWLRLSAEETATSLFSLRPALLREMLYTGAAPEPLIEAAEVLAARGGALSLCLLDWRHALPQIDRRTAARERDSRVRRVMAAHRLRAEKAGMAQIVRAALDTWLAAVTQGPSLRRDIKSALRFVETLLALSPGSAVLLKVFVAALHRSRRLPPDLRGAFFELASERQNLLWNTAALPPATRGFPAGQAFCTWLQERWTVEGKRLYFLLRASGDPEVVREADRLDVFAIAAERAIWKRWDAVQLRLFLQIVALFLPKPSDRSGYCPFLAALRDVQDQFPSGEEARDALLPLIRPLESAARDPERRERARCVLTSLLEMLDGAPREQRRAAVTARLARSVLLLLRYAERATPEAWTVQADALCGAVLALDRNAPEASPALLAGLLEALPTTKTEARGDTAMLSLAAVDVALFLAEGGGPRLLPLLRTAMAHIPAAEEYEEQDLLRQGADVLRRYPEIGVPLRSLFEQQPRRCLALIRRLGMAARLGQDVLAPLAACDFAATGKTALSGDPLWQDVFARVPDAAPQAAALWQADWLLGRDSGAVPAGVRRLLEETTRRATELAYLEARCNAGEAAPALIARRDNLRDRLRGADSDAARARLAEELCERLAQAVAEAQMAAAERQTEACYRNRLRQIVGPLPPHLAITPDLENAVLLSATLTTNRALLHKLLRAWVDGDTDWPRTRPENAAFLESLAARGADVDVWLGAHPRRVRLRPLPKTPAQTFTLALETDPLHVLQMGNYFDTCLSAGTGCNAFSTVTNAVERNKRVLYARDAAGRVVARQLLGISAEGGLLGFHIYCSLENEPMAEALRAAMRRYGIAFAARCRIPLAESGTIPTLFAEEWYDDGALPWNTAEEKHSGATQTHGSTPPPALP